MNRAVLLDVSAIIFRSYYGNMYMKTRNTSFPTGAVFGFTNTLLKIIELYNPKYICAALDVKRSTLKRRESYEGYKAKRDNVPEDIIKQMGKIEELLSGFNIQSIKIPGYEADDVIGSVSKKLSDQGIESIVITGDKDLAQLLSDKVKIGFLGQGNDKKDIKLIESRNGVKDHIGVYPEMIPDLFGLIGDSSDGIPGIRKLGIKKAIPILEKYNNLESIYNNLDELVNIPGIGKGLIKNIKEDKEMAFLSRKLATINKALLLDIDLGDLEFKQNKNKLYNLFTELEFKSIINKMALKEKSDEKFKEKNLLSLFDTVSEKINLNEKKEEPIIENINYVINKEQIMALNKKIENNKKITFLYDNAGIIFYLEKIYYIGFYDKSHKLTDMDSINILFSHENVEYISYNIKNFLNKGIKIKGNIFDTLIAFHLLTSHTRENIDDFIYYETGINLKSYKETFKKLDSKELAKEEFSKFLLERVKVLDSTYKKLNNELKEKELDDIYNNIELKLIKVLSHMEEKGIKLDISYLNNYSKLLSVEVKKIEKKIYELAGEKFNLNSPKQLGEILFVKLNIAPIKKTKTGYSTNAEVLEILKNKGEKIASYIIDYRKYTKLLNTYIITLPTMVDKESRIHTTFNQTGTTTGRLSSSDPNLQNIPIKSKEGFAIRKGFIAKENHLFLCFDYSQIELRVLGELSKDEVLIEAYKNNFDLHKLTAMKLLNVNDEKEITQEDRNMGKTINFSIIYGKTPFGLSKELDIRKDVAKDYIEKYFAEFPKVKIFEKSIIDFAEKNEYVKTYFGRKRIINGINSKNKNIKHQNERMAVNAVIQGTAADIIKKVMIEIYESVIKNNDDEISMILQVHDELLFEVKNEFKEKYFLKIKKIMENHIKLEHINLKTSFGCGLNWAETK